MTYITKNISKRIVAIFIIIFIVLIIFSLYIRYLLTNSFNPSWRLGILVLIGVFILKILFDFTGMSFKKWDNGAEAERKVRKVSAELPKEFKVIKSVITGSTGNVDEVIVGPTGVWVIEVKSHNGKITFDGKELIRNGKPFEKKFLGQTWFEMCEIKDLLKRELRQDFFVQPVLCFAGKYTEVHFGFTPVKGVYVIGLDWLNRLVTRGVGHSLDSASIEAIARLLDKYKE